MWLEVINLRAWGKEIGFDSRHGVEMVLSHTWESKKMESHDRLGLS